MTEQLVKKRTTMKDNAIKAQKDFEFYYRYSKLGERDKELISNIIDFMIANKKSGEN